MIFLKQRGKKKRKGKSKYVFGYKSHKRTIVIFPFYEHTHKKRRNRKKQRNFEGGIIVFLYFFIISKVKLKKKKKGSKVFTFSRLDSTVVDG